MKTKSIIVIVLLLSFASGFSQIKKFGNAAFQLQPSVFDKAETPVASIEMLGKMKPSGANPYGLPSPITYKPIIYHWTEAAQRMDDYKFMQYGCHPQDINGRDLVLDVITDDMIQRLLHRPSPN